MSFVHPARWVSTLYRATVNPLLFTIFAKKKEKKVFFRIYCVMKEFLVKEKTYQIEKAFLSPYATFSEKSKGRARVEEPCAMRTDFQRDKDRLIYCKAFRRLKNKTQVFFSPHCAMSGLMPSCRLGSSHLPAWERWWPARCMLRLCRSSWYVRPPTPMPIYSPISTGKIEKRQQDYKPGYVVAGLLVKRYADRLPRRSQSFI